MQVTSQAYAAQVASGSQPPAEQVLVDWQRTGQYQEVEVTSVEVERTLVSDLPVEVTLVSGVAAARATVGLAGDPADNTRHPGLLYSPFQQQSPLYGVDSEGAPAKVLMGQQIAGQPELFSTLVGQVRDLQVDATPGEVTATAQLVDGREKFRFPPRLDVVVGDDPVIPTTPPLSGLPQKPGLDVQWIVDVIARQAGYYASPPTRAQCLVSATLHGSAWPEVGSLRTSSYWDSSSASLAYPVRFAQAKFGLGMADQAFSFTDPLNFAQWFFADGVTLPQNDNTAMSFEGWYYLSPTHNDELGGVYDTTATTRRIIWRTDGAGHVGLHWSRDGVTYIDTYPATARITTTGWHYIAWTIIYNTLVTTVRIRVDGVTDTMMPATPSAYAGPPLASMATYNTGAEAIQLTQEFNNSQNWNNNFTPTAVLEEGLSTLTVTPGISADADAWSILQDIARATAGVIFVDERDTFRGWNRRHFGTAAPSTATQRTLRASVPITGITIQRLADRVRNIIRVPVSPYRITAPAIIWSLADIVQIAPRGTYTQDIDLLGDQAYQVSTDTHVYPGGGPLVDGRSGYRAARRQDGTGDAVTNLTMTVTPLATSIRVQITNPNGYPVWLVSPTGAGYPSTSDGLPAMVVVGRLITQTGTEPDTGDASASSTTTVEWRDALSISQHGERPLPALEASGWLQSTDDALMLAREIGYVVSQPRPQLPPISIAYDPALQIGDRVWVVDDSGITGLNDPAWIVGSLIRSRADGATQDLTLRLIAPPGALVLDDPDRGALDGRWRWA